MHIPFQLATTLLRLHYSRTPLLIIHFRPLTFFGFFFSFSPSPGRTWYLGNLILPSVSTTWVLQTVLSFLTPSFPSRRDDPGDGSRVAFHFRRGCDSVAGDEGTLERCEGMRRAGDTVGFVFLSRGSVPWDSAA
jgi:hypothetical protein